MEQGSFLDFHIWGSGSASRPDPGLGREAKQGEREREEIKISCCSRRRRRGPRLRAHLFCLEPRPGRGCSMTSKRGRGAREKDDGGLVAEQRPRSSSSSRSAFLSSETRGWPTNCRQDDKDGKAPHVLGLFEKVGLTPKVPLLSLSRSGNGGRGKSDNLKVELISTTGIALAMTPNSS